MSKMSRTVWSMTCAALLLAALAGCGSDVRERNKALARRAFKEVLSEGHFERAGEFYAADFAVHGLHRDASLAEDQAAARGWKQAFPDLDYKLEQVIADGPDFVVARTAISGVGARSGMPVHLAWISVFWLDDRKVIRTAGYRNRHEALKAVGLEE